MVSIDAEMSVQAQAQAHLSLLTVSFQKAQLYGLVFSPNMFIACKTEFRVFLSPTKNLCKLGLKGADSSSVTLKTEF